MTGLRIDSNKTTEVTELLAGDVVIFERISNDWLLRIDRYGKKLRFCFDRPDNTYIKISKNSKEEISEDTTKIIAEILGYVFGLEIGGIACDVREIEYSYREFSH